MPVDPPASREVSDRTTDPLPPYPSPGRYPQACQLAAVPAEGRQLPVARSIQHPCLPMGGHQRHCQQSCPLLQEEPCSCAQPQAQQHGGPVEEVEAIVLEKFLAMIAPTIAAQQQGRHLHPYTWPPSFHQRPWDPEAPLPKSLQLPSAPVEEHPVSDPQQSSER